MRYVIERMTIADLPRVAEIDRVAYNPPSTWPASTYLKELQENRNSHYVVLRERPPQVLAEKQRKKRIFPFSLLPSRPAVTIAPPQDATSIIGFAGLWLTIDEAHITTLAVHPDYRGQGLGEFLLIGMIDLAYSLAARWVTLEVRASNTLAQNLYQKYGFAEAGVRRRYYSDNDEDALIMWTEDIHLTSYKQKYLALKSALLKRLEAETSQERVIKEDTHAHIGN